MDANEDLNKGKLSRDLNQLGMWDLGNEMIGQKVPEIPVRCKKQIDGIWSTN